MNFNRRILIRCTSKIDVEPFKSKEKFDIKTISSGLGKPLKIVEKEKPKEDIIEFDSKNGFRIAFKCVKNITSAPNECIVEINNLSESTCTKLISKGIFTEVYACYENEDILSNIVFGGEIRSAEVSRLGSDKTLRLTIQTKFDLDQKIYNKAFISETEIKKLIESMLTSFKVPFDPKNILIKGDCGWRGLVFNESVESILNKLANWFNFTWSMQDYGFLALDDKEFLLSNDTAEKFILNLSFLIDDNDRNGKGYALKTILNPTAQIGYEIKYNSRYNGSDSFKIYKITHSADTHSDAWFTDIVGYKTDSLKKRKDIWDPFSSK